MTRSKDNSAQRHILCRIRENHQQETTKSTLDSLQMKHEGNTQDKETKARALIQKFKAYKMKEDESVKMCFPDVSCRTDVPNNGYTTSDYLRRIIKSLLSKWRPMVITLKWQRKSQTILRKFRRR